jgi:selenide,water dikinase
MKGRADLSAVPFEMQEVLFDPQTSGGLLLSVPEEAAEEMKQALRAKGLPAGIIGTVTMRQDCAVLIRE